ncbi:major facilitator superfamily domain-containing protein, partial [Mycotypha africana]|uniref:major facilitator superfamily domain-containing protein n=1 Tax=Mycotypha africana TaxID=64632 RepID=UPI00230071E5
DDDEYPDGGYGWVIVFGAFCAQITYFGVISSVMQDYYQQNVFTNSDPKVVVDLSFVGSLTLVFLDGMSPFVRLAVARLGVKPVMIIGSLLITLGLEMAGFATQVWHLYLTQSIVFGTGASCIYVIAMSITPQWFKKRRGLALGIVAAGSGMGGLVVPLIVTPINRQLGAQWTYRVLGFICLFCDVIACVFVKERQKRDPAAKKKKLSEILDLSVLKNLNFLLFIIASNIALLGYFVPFFFVPAYATYLGLSDSQGSSLIAVASALNFVGRFTAGCIGDYIGPINADIIFTLLASISGFLIWTFAKTYSSLVGFMVVFGFACGSFFPLMSPITASILGMERFPSGIALVIGTNMFAMFGTNIASAIETSPLIASTSPPFFSYKIFTGVTYLVATIALLWLKLRVNRNPCSKL